MKTTYVQRRNAGTGELELVLKPPRRRSQAVHIMEDLNPYTAVSGDMAGKEISGRKQHREFLKRNGFIEVGNEKEYMTRNGGRTEDHPVVNDRHTDGLERAVGEAYRDLYG